MVNKQEISYDEFEFINSQPDENRIKYLCGYFCTVLDVSQKDTKKVIKKEFSNLSSEYKNKIENENNEEEKKKLEEILEGITKADKELQKSSTKKAFIGDYIELYKNLESDSKTEIAEAEDEEESTLPAEVEEDNTGIDEVEDT